MGTESQSYAELFSEERNRINQEIQRQKEIVLKTIQWSDDSRIKSSQENFYNNLSAIQYYGENKDKKGNENFGDIWRAMLTEAAIRLRNDRLNGIKFNDPNVDKVFRDAYNLAVERKDFGFAYDFAKYGEFLTEDLIRELAETAQKSGKKEFADSIRSRKEKFL